MSRRRNFSLPNTYPEDRIEHEDEEEKQPEEEYEVEAILEAKRFNGVGMYRIKWLGYGHEHNSWEPAENLTNCQKKLDKFREEKRKKKLQRDASTPASTFTTSEPISFTSSAPRPSTTYLRLEKDFSASSPSASTSTSRPTPTKTLSIPLSRRLGPSNMVISPIMGSKRYIWPPNEVQSDIPSKRARIEHDVERNDRKLDDVRGKESKSNVSSPRLSAVSTARAFRFEGERNSSTSVRRENVGDPTVQPPTFMDVFSNVRDLRENVADATPNTFFKEVASNTRDRRDGVADSFLPISSNEVVNKARDRRENVGDPIAQTPTFLEVFSKTRDVRDNIADTIIQTSSEGVINHTRDRRENIADPTLQPPTFLDVFSKTEPTPQTTFRNVANKARERRESDTDGIMQTPTFLDVFSKPRDRRENVTDPITRIPSKEVVPQARDRRENVADPKLQPPSRDLNKTRERRGNVADLKTPSRDVNKNSRDRRENGVDPIVQTRSKDVVDHTRDRRENGAGSNQQIPAYREVQKARDPRENVADTIVRGSSNDQINKPRDRQENIAVPIAQTSFKDVVNRANNRRDKVADPVEPIPSGKDVDNKTRDRRENVADVQTRSKDYRTRDPDPGKNVTESVVQAPSREVRDTTRDRRENGADPVVQAPSNDVAIRTRGRPENVADPILNMPTKDVINTTTDRRENIAGPIVQTSSQNPNATADRQEILANPIVQAPSNNAITPARNQRANVADPNMHTPARDVVGEKPFKGGNSEKDGKSFLDTQEKIDESFDKIMEQIGPQNKGSPERTMGNAEHMDIPLDLSTPPTGVDVTDSPILPPLPIETPSIVANVQVTESVSTLPVLQTPISVTSRPISVFHSRTRTSLSTLDCPSPNFPNIASILNTVQRAASNTVPLALIASEKDDHASASNGSGLIPKNQITATLSSLAANSLSAASISKIRQHWSKLYEFLSPGLGLDAMLCHGKGELRMYEDAKKSKSGAYRLDPYGDIKSDGLSAFVKRCSSTNPERPICTIDGNTVCWLGQLCKHGGNCRHFAHVGLVPMNKLGDGRLQRHLQTAKALCVRYVISADRAFSYVKMSGDAEEMLPLAVYATIPGTTGVVEINPELDKWAKWLESKNFAGIVPLVSGTLFIFSSNYPGLRSSIDRDSPLPRNPTLLIALCKDGKVPVEPTYAASDSFLETKYIPSTDISDVDSLRLEFLASYFQMPESFASAVCDKNVAIYSLDPEHNQEVKDMINLVKGFKGIPLLCTCTNGIWNEAFNRGEISHVLAHRNTRKVINDLPGISRIREQKNPDLPGGQVLFAYFGSDVAAGEFGYIEFYRGGGYVIPTARFLVENPGFITSFIRFAEMKDLQNQAPWHLSIHPDVVSTLKTSATVTSSDTIISPDELLLALVSFAQRKPTIAKNLDRTRHELVSTSESGQELLPNLLLNAARLHMLYHKCIRHFVVLVSTDERAQYYGNDYKGASIMTERTFQTVFGMTSVCAE